jgi:type I restriction enzyme S subunit
MESDFYMKIGDIAEVFDGPHATPKKIENGPYFLSISSLSNGHLDLTKSAHLSEEQFVKWTKRVTPQEGDVLFSYETRLGEAALMPGSVKACLGRRMGLLRPKLDQVLPEYLLYAYLAPDFQGEIKKRTNYGATVERISLKEISDFSIRIPPLNQQKKIVRILKSLNDKITLNREINQTLEQMAQVLFKSWFVDFDPVIDNALDAGNLIPDPLAERAALRQAARASDDFQSLPDDVRQLFPSEFEDSELGWIPKGWESSSVGAEFDVTMGQSPPGSSYNENGEGVAFFQGKTDFGFRFPVNRIYCTEPKRVAKKNDTLVSVRAPVGAINLASENCSIGRGLSAVRHHSGSISYTYYAMANLSKLFEVFEGEGTVFGSINQKDFKGLPQIKPSLMAVNKFNELCLAWDQRIELNSSEIESLTKLRDTLLPKLISGELRLDSPEIEKAKSLLDGE